MHLHAAITPPPDLVAEARAALSGQRADVGPGDVREGRRGRIGLRLRRERVEVPVGPDGLDLLDPAMVLLPLTSFGKVTPRDAGRVSEAIAEALAPLTRPVLRAQGGVALEPMGDDRVWVGLVGDEAGLRAVASAVVAAVERVGIFCDRRIVRPHLPLARVNQHTTEADLESALAALAALPGRAWTIDHVSLLQRPADPRTQPSRELERIPFGTG